MQFRPQPAGRAADAIPAAGAKRTEAVSPNVRADVVDQQVHPGAAGDLSHALGDVFLVVIDHVVRAQAAGQFRFLGRAGGGDHG